MPITYISLGRSDRFHMNRFCQQLFELLAAISCTTGICAAKFDYEKQPALIKYDQCIKAYGYSCFGFVSKNNVILRATPDERSENLGSLKFGDGIALIEPFENAEHPGWVMVVATRVHGSDRSLIAWTPQSGVLFRWQLQRVVGCWPVAKLSWTVEGAGESEGGNFEPQFDLNGSIGGRSAYARKFFSSYAIYYARGIFLIYDSAKKVQLEPTFTLDYSKRRVTNDYLSIQKKKTGNPPYQFVKEEDLKGCTKIPAVDPLQTLLPKERLNKSTNSALNR
jgi:hypothetical protein